MSGLIAASAAAMAGGVVANMAAQDAVSNARGAVIGSNTAQQRLFNDAIFKTADVSTNRFGNFSGQMAGKEAQLADFYNAHGTTLPPSGPNSGTIPATTSAAVANQGQQEMDRVNAFTRQQRGAMANLRSFGDVLGGVNRDVMGDQGLIAKYNSFKHGQANVEPLQLNAADSAGNGLKTLGDVLKGLGSIGMGAGLGGALAGAGGIAGTGITAGTMGGGTGLFGMNGGMPIFGKG